MKARSYSEWAFIFGGLALLSFAWNGPLQYYPWRTFWSEAASLVACCALLAAASLWARSHRSTVDIPVTIVAVTIFVCAQVVLDTVLGRLYFRGDAIIVVSLVLASAISILVGFSWGRQDAATPLRASGYFLFLIALVLAGIVSTAIALRQLLSPESESLFIIRPSVHLGIARAPGNLGQPNHLALVLAMAYASVLILAERGALRWPIAGFIILVLFCGLNIASSRIGIISIAAIHLVALTIALRCRLAAKLWMWTLSACVFALSIVAYRSWVQLAFVTDPRALNETQSRTQLWIDLLTAALERPWLGWGWLSTAEAHAAWATAAASAQASTYAHNVLIDLAVWFGFPAAALISAAVCWIVYRLIKSAVRPAGEGLLLCSPFALQCLVEFPFAYAYFLVPVGLAWGFSLSALSMRTFSVPWPVSVAFAAISAAAIALVAVPQYATAELDTRTRRLSAAGVGEEVIGDAGAAYPLWDQLAGLATAVIQSPRRNVSAADLQKERAVRYRYPVPRIMMRYMVLLAINGQTNRAQAELRAIRLTVPIAWPSIVKQLCESTERYPEIKDILTHSQEASCEVQSPLSALFQPQQ